MEEQQTIDRTMAKCTPFITDEVIFENLKPRIMDIFPRSTIERVQGGGDRASYDIMTKLCDEVKRRPKKDFLKFVEAVRKDHEHVAQYIETEYNTQLLEQGRQREQRLPSQQISRQANKRVNSQSAAHVHEVPVVECQYERENPLPSGGQMDEGQGRATQFRNLDELGRDQRSSISSSSNQWNLPSAAASSAVSLPGQRNAARTTLPLISCYQQARNTDPTSVYKMESNPRGFAYIISNETFANEIHNRLGAGKEVENLFQMFSYLNFRVEIKNNLTSSDMKKQLEEWSKDERLHTVDALAVAILTHGEKHDRLLGTELSSGFLDKSEIMKIFGTKNCPSMRGKPKLFIVQACRGDEADTERSSTSSQPSGASNPSMHYEGMHMELTVNTDYYNSNVNREGKDVADDSGDGVRAETADMCFMHSSSVGYLSYRDPKFGSPFVEKLTEIVKDHAHDKEVIDMIRKLLGYFATEQLTEGTFTMPTCDILPCKWFFNPPHTH